LPSSPQPYGYGVVYDAHAIDAALQTADAYDTLGYHHTDADPLERGTHGTHVLSIAAGNGRGGDAEGMAPDADLVFVHLTSVATGPAHSLGDSVTLLEALDFIVSTAGNRPCVINLSMGNHGGPHDGSLLAEQAIDALVTSRPGIAVVQSCGNYYSRPIHTSGQLRPGATTTLYWETDAADVTPNELEVWYPGVDVFEVEVRSPDHRFARTVALGGSTTITIEGDDVGRAYHRSHEPNNKKNHIDVFLYPEAPAGTWEIELRGRDVADGRFHAWVERDAACAHCQSLLRADQAVHTTTTGTICNGLWTIAVGAYDAHSPGRDIASFSSCGPTSDGRQKPDVVAPGSNVIGARSAPLEPADPPMLTTRMSGTSMACPHVTGTIALMFEAAGRPLTIEETRRALFRSAEHVPVAADEAPARVGDGYLDVRAAVDAVRNAAPIETNGHVDEAVAEAVVAETVTRCFTPPVAEDPTDFGSFPVGHSDYTGTAVTIGGTSRPVQGVVFYPADRAGDGTPYNTRAGLAPVVFIAHGNHDPAVPNFRGYDYFQQDLAKMGIVSVSVDCNVFNGPTGGQGNIIGRALLIDATITHFRSDPAFGGHIDFARIGLFGHSRGAEAVLVVPLVGGRVTPLGVVSVAPTDNAIVTTPQGFAFMTILPAGDGDVVTNDGAKFYDRADPTPFKCQFYVHHSNHNFFNRRWLEDDHHGPPVMPRAAHERILDAYCCAFFRHLLLGHATRKFLSGDALPAAPTRSGQVFISFERPGQVTVDDFQHSGTNSLGQPNTVAGGLNAIEYLFNQAGPLTFNASFFGDTAGLVEQSRPGMLRLQLPAATDVTGKEVWIRAAEVWNGTSVPTAATGFALGLEDAGGRTVWVDSDDVGTLLRPYDRKADDLADPMVATDLTKTMLATMRFPAGCFTRSAGLFDIRQVRALLVRTRPDERPIAFDQLQIVTP
jgi:subtilisin family serine protease